ncbi:hypothetical protein XH96_32390 [Bradyrhizobium sp. CCBAU 51765]|nr:hypothetical protein XH96_32390 [Bradyrhizobium sp. CCBAU 51765]
MDGSHLRAVLLALAPLQRLLVDGELAFAVYRAVEQVDGGPERIIKTSSLSLVMDELPCLFGRAHRRLHGRMAKDRGCFVLRCEGAARTRAASVDERRAKRKQASRKLAGRDRRESGSTAKFGFNILKQAPARWMRPGPENRGPTLILLRERSKPAETLPGLAKWERGVAGRTHRKKR